MDLRYVVSLELAFFASFPSAQGVGAHTHDVETAEFKLVAFSTDSEAFQKAAGMRCDPVEQVVLVTRVSGKAHGLFWYRNVSDTDAGSRFPIRCVHRLLGRAPGPQELRFLRLGAQALLQHHLAPSVRMHIWLSLLCTSMPMKSMARSPYLGGLVLAEAI
ncbi:hypothetical protein [Pyxidicoccus trucidator]|uniref:hypothetical protein n=1 Tax=Pyxidicoccus trucidator TaxID=2709662 RepID=UPI00196782FD|nr:hypothetical protein [Pyxidicoccus trucidator]